MHTFEGVVMKHLLCRSVVPSGALSPQGTEAMSTIGVAVGVLKKKMRYSKIVARSNLPSFINGRLKIHCPRKVSVS